MNDGISKRDKLCVVTTYALNNSLHSAHAPLTKVANGMSEAQILGLTAAINKVVDFHLDTILFAISHTFVYRRAITTTLPGMHA